MRRGSRNIVVKLFRFAKSARTDVTAVSGAFHCDVEHTPYFRIKF